MPLERPCTECREYAQSAAHHATRHNARIASWHASCNPVPALPNWQGSDAAQIPPLCVSFPFCADVCFCRKVCHYSKEKSNMHRHDTHKKARTSLRCRAFVALVCYSSLKRRRNDAITTMLPMKHTTKNTSSGMLKMKVTSLVPDASSLPGTPYRSHPKQMFDPGWPS